MNLRIGIDLDSTLNNLGPAWAKWISETIKPGFTVNDMTAWDLTKIVGSDRVYDFLWMHGSFGNLKPMPHSETVTRRLQLAGHELYVVSKAHFNVWKEKGEWLLKYFGHIPEDNYISCGHKGRLMKGLDVLVDDGLHNFRDFPNHGIIMDQPWNRSGEVDRTGRRYRAMNWLSVELIVTRIVAEAQGKFAGGPDLEIVKGAA